MKNKCFGESARLKPCECDSQAAGSPVTCERCSNTRVERKKTIWRNETGSQLMLRRKGLISGGIHRIDEAKCALGQTISRAGPRKLPSVTSADRPHTATEQSFPPLRHIHSRLKNSSKLPNSARTKIQLVPLHGQNIKPRMKTTGIDVSHKNRSHFSKHR